MIGAVPVTVDLAHGALLQEALAAVDMRGPGIEHRHIQFEPVGVVLFELFTQLKPWADVSNKTTAQAIMNGERLQWPRSCSVPRELRKLARRAWSRDPVGTRDP